MSEQAKLVVKIALLVVGLVVVGALANRQLRKASVTGEEELVG